MNEHDHWTERLSEYLDDELPPAERTALDQHLAGCAVCREMLGELRGVVARARSLTDTPTDTPPASDLWPGVAAGIRADPGQPRVLQLRSARRFSFTLPQLVAAGLALMVLSGGMVWIARLGGERTDFPALGAETREATPAALVEAHYDEAIADLQRTLDAGRARLDPDTVRVLEQNLVAIDHAIEQCRRALDDDPANVYLSDHLVAAKKRKLALLRRANAMTDRPS